MSTMTATRDRVDAAESDDDDEVEEVEELEGGEDESVPAANGSTVQGT